MLELLEGLLSKQVTILVGGHYVGGTLTCVDLTKRLAFIESGNETWIIAVDQVGMVKQS